MDINGCLKESLDYYMQTQLLIFALIPLCVLHLDLTVSGGGTPIESVAQAKSKDLIYFSLYLIPLTLPLALNLSGSPAGHCLTSKMVPLK